LQLPQPFTLTAASYNITVVGAVTTASLEVYSWNGTGPGTLLAVQDLSVGDLAIGAHDVTLSTPLQIDNDSFCIGLRSDETFSIGRDGSSGPGNQSFISAPDCGGGAVFTPISVATTGNLCMHPTITP
jgi:hypothetical protein